MNVAMYAESASGVDREDPGRVETESFAEGQALTVSEWGQKIWPRRRAGPLTAVMAELIDWLVAQGYAPSTQRNHVRAAAWLGSWMAADDVGLEDLDTARILLMVAQDNKHYPSHRSANENISAVVRFLQQTGRIQPAPATDAPVGPAQVCLAAWLRFLEVEQGQGSNWIGKARSFGRDFLEAIEDEDGSLAWNDVDATMANDFLVRAAAGYSSSTAQSMASLLRGLLTWAATNGWISETVALGILSARNINTDLPKSITTDEVAALTQAVDLHSRTGRRDAAIIAMLTRLGARAAEVAGLTLDDIDWRQPSVRLVGKNGRVLALPIPVDVGEALVEYLRVRRAEPTERGVFIRSMPPLTVLSGAGVSHVIAKHARIAGLEHVSAHRLRHTAACQVLTGGGTLGQVRELLGHANLASAMTYARVDMTPLRRLAPSWGRLP